MKYSKKIVTGAVAAALTLALAMPVCASPKIMPDGTIFDAEYYAAQNPDVVAALGTDEDLLYQHYELCGKTEGRLAAAPGTTADMAVPYEGTGETVTAAETAAQEIVTSLPDGEYVAYTPIAANLTKSSLQVSADDLSLYTWIEGEEIPEYPQSGTYELPLAKKVKYSADILDSDGMTPLKINTKAKMQKFFGEHMNYINHMFITVKNGKVTKILIDDLAD